MNARSLYQYLLGAALIAALALTLIRHVRYADQPCTLDDLLRVATVLPEVAQPADGELLQSASKQQLSYAGALLINALLEQQTVTQLSHLRVFDGLLAACAVYWLYRVGRRCADKLTGCGAALLLAVAPPALWGRHALTIMLVLMSFEAFLMAVRTDSILRWSVWFISSVLLFTTGVSAEAILLQTWFVMLALIVTLWYWCGALLPPDLHEQPEKPRTFRLRTEDEEYEYDAGLIRTHKRHSLLVVILALIFAGFFLMGGRIFGLTAKGVILVLVTSVTGTLCTGLILMTIPQFEREWAQVKHLILSPHWATTPGDSSEVFVTIGKDRILHVLFAYAGAALLFLPMLYTTYRQIDLFVPAWELRRWAVFMWRSATLPQQVLAALPFLWLIITGAGYAAQRLPRHRLMGCLAAVVLSSMYIMQQRYAVHATPFFLIGVAGCLATSAELVYSFVHPQKEGVEIMVSVIR